MALEKTRGSAAYLSPTVASVERFVAVGDAADRFDRSQDVNDSAHDDDFTLVGAEGLRSQLYDRRVFDCGSVERIGRDVLTDPRFMLDWNLQVRGNGLTPRYRVAYDIG